MLPVDDPKFWKDRLDRVKASGRPLYVSVYDVGEARWAELDRAHRIVLAGLLSPGDKILDAGCGYGSMVKILPKIDLDYTGIDLSPDLIQEARKLHPYLANRFVVGRLENLPFEDRQFDFAIARSVDGMIRDNLGYAAWEAMEKELIRVADKVVLLNYGEPLRYILHWNTTSSSVHTLNTINQNGSYLIYRLSTGGVCEIYDLFVCESQRRKGVGTQLVRELGKKLPGCHLYAFTRCSNTEARSFYLRLGFQETLVPDYYPGCDAILMTRSEL